MSMSAKRYFIQEGYFDETKVVYFLGNIQVLCVFARKVIYYKITTPKESIASERVFDNQHNLPVAPQVLFLHSLCE